MNTTTIILSISSCLVAFGYLIYVKRSLQQRARVRLAKLRLLEPPPTARERVDTVLAFGTIVTLYVFVVLWGLQKAHVIR